MRRTTYFLWTAIFCGAGFLARSASTQELPPTISTDKIVQGQPADRELAPRSGFLPPDSGKLSTSSPGIQAGPGEFQPNAPRLFPNPNESFPQPKSTDPFGAAVAETQPVPQTMRARQVRRTIIETVYEPVPKEELDSLLELQKAISTLKNETDEEKNAVAIASVRTKLTEQFERDLQQREKELAQVEERVAMLRDQLEKRKNAQDDIITLRLQTIVNEANGLGFPDSYPTAPSDNTVPDHGPWSTPASRPLQSGLFPFKEDPSKPARLR
ncbi:MAG: hypothetical protein R3C20_08380 [Planctomycetaceae bacterium]